MKVRFSPGAAESIEAADRWWIENRRAAPTLFEDELGLALQLIEDRPLAGARVADPNAQFDDLRRVVLGATRFLLYYRVSEETVEVLLVHQSNRGDRPRL